MSDFHWLERWSDSTDLVWHRYGYLFVLKKVSWDEHRLKVERKWKWDQTDAEVDLKALTIAEARSNRRSSTAPIWSVVVWSVHRATTNEVATSNTITSHAEVSLAKFSKGLLRDPISGMSVWTIVDQAYFIMILILDIHHKQEIVERMCVCVEGVKSWELTL